MSIIGYDEVFAAVTAKEPLIVDVRTEDEFASGRIPGATNIPLSEVHIKMLLEMLLFFSRWNTPSPCQGRSSETSMESLNQPKTPASSHLARLVGEQQRWGTNWMRWASPWWRLTLAASLNGRRRVERLRSRRLWLLNVRGRHWDHLGLDRWYN